MSTLVTKRTLLPLDNMGEFYQAVVQVPFKIQGLAAWNVDPLDQVSSMQVGSTMAEASGGYVPAMFYAMGEAWSYSKLAAALEAGEVVPQSWGPDYFLAPGTMFRIRVTRTGVRSGIAPVVFAIWGAKVEAYSEEILKSLPSDGYFDLLVTERQSLQQRINQIDTTLVNVSRPGKSWIVPTDEADNGPQTIGLNWIRSNIDRVRKGDQVALMALDSLNEAAKEGNTDAVTALSAIRTYLRENPADSDPQKMTVADWTTERHDARAVELGKLKHAGSSGDDNPEGS